MASPLQYGLQTRGVRNLKHSMSDMICDAARGAGIHSIVNRNLYSVNHEMQPPTDVDTSATKSRLLEASKKAGFELTPIQVETVVNTVWRPKSRTRVSYETYRQESVPTTVYRTFDSPITDMGSPVFIDLPPGMGKTIVSSIASLLVSLERRGEIDRQHVYSTQRGCTEVVDKQPNGAKVSMIFCPKHVHHQWMFAARKAVDIVSRMYPSKEFQIESNKKARFIDSSRVDAALIVCDSSAFSLSRALEADIVYGTLCFDECTENCDVKNNAVYSITPNDLTYGRLVLISADFSKMGDVNSKVGSCRKGSMIRRVFGESSTAEMYHAISRNREGGGFYGYGNATTSRATSIVACLTMNAVFPSSMREEVVNTSADLLAGVNLYTFGINYKRSIFERLGSSAAFDLTPTNGVDRFMDAVGVDISGCTSIEEIMTRVEANNVIVNNRVNRRVMRALEVLREVVKEECIICMEKMEKASIIQPCFHVVCQECLPRLGQSGKCPMCRGVIHGAVTSDVVGKRTFEDAFEEEDKEEVATVDTLVSQGHESQVPGGILPMGEAFTRAIAEILPVNNGSLPMQVTMGHVLRSLSVAHERSGGGTFRVVVVCSQVDLNTTGFSSDGYEIIRYRATGTSRSPVTRKRLVKQLDDFQAEDGRKKLMLVHDETSENIHRTSHRSGKDDNITGMDFPRLEAVVSIGSENRSQRVGRLCRMSRLFMDESKRDAIYVELSGV